LVRSNNDAPDFVNGYNQAIRYTNLTTQTVYGWASGFNSGVGESDSLLNYSIDFATSTDSAYFAIAPQITNDGNLTYQLANNITVPGTGIFYHTVNLKAKVFDTGGVDNGGTNASVIKNFSINVISGAINQVWTTDLSDRLQGDILDNILNGGIGSDRLIGDGGNDTLYGDYIEGQPLLSYAFDVRNNFTFDDIIQGNNGDDIIYGQLGNDTLYGNVGNDILYGGLGNNILWGVDGSDTFVALQDVGGVSNNSRFSRWVRLCWFIN
jgi:Ca2+-binding RTX toxin-like protein